MDEKEKKLWVVARGVDTLILNVFSTDDHGKPVKQELCQELEKRLDLWKKEAQEAHADIPTVYQFNDLLLHMCPNGGGRGQWPYMLKSREITLYISRGQWNGIGAVRLSSAYLWSHGLTHALGAVQQLVDGVFGGKMYLQASEVHLCADIAGWDGVRHLDRSKHFVTRSRKRSTYAEPDWGYDAELRDYSYGLQATGFDFSRGGPVSCTIYEKSREIQRSEKLWMEDVWRCSGWSEDDGPVWRVEARLKREALHEIELEGAFHGVENASDLLGLLPLLWAYVVGAPKWLAIEYEKVPDGWLRCVVEGSGSSRTRLQTHPAWKVVQGAFLEPGRVPEQFGKVVRKRWREKNIARLVEGIIGGLTSFSAFVGGELAREGADISLALEQFYPYAVKYLDRRGWDFDAEVRRKQMRLGTEKEAANE